MVYSKEITLSCQGICDIKNITDEVSQAVEESKIKDGIVVVFCSHSTVGITTIEYEEGILKDFCELLDKFIPKDKSYHHDSTWGEANGFSHLKASLNGPSVSVPIINSQLQLGTWQQMVLCDFDNKSRKRKGGYISAFSLEANATD